MRPRIYEKYRKLRCEVARLINVQMFQQIMRPPFMSSWSFFIVYLYMYVITLQAFFEGVWIFGQPVSPSEQINQSCIGVWILNQAVSKVRIFQVSFYKLKSNQLRSCLEVLHAASALYVNSALQHLDARSDAKRALARHLWQGQHRPIR